MPSRIAATTPPRVYGRIDAAHHLPARQPEPVARPPSAPAGRSGRARGRPPSVIGTIMIVRIDHRREQSTAVLRSPRKNGVQPRKPSEERLEVVLDERAEDEDPPEADDDARHGGEHLDQRADDAAHAGRRELGQEERDRDRERRGEQHGDERRERRAVEEVERAVDVARYRVPGLVPDEREPELSGSPARRRRRPCRRSGRRGRARPSAGERR